MAATASALLLWALPGSAAADAVAAVAAADAVDCVREAVRQPALEPVVVPVLGSALGPALESAREPERVAAAVWDRLALCESSGNWHVNTGNGYYGGVQISAETWREAGGSGFAKRPDLATRAQQITVAEKILRMQGWGAWPSCARQLGLLQPKPKPVPGPVPGPKPVPKPGPGPGPAPAPAPTPGPVSGPVPARYVVRAGDSLSGIAARYHLSGGWPALYKLNRAVIGSDPNVLATGTVLRLR